MLYEITITGNIYKTNWHYSRTRRTRHIVTPWFSLFVFEPFPA